MRKIRSAVDAVFHGGSRFAATGTENPGFAKIRQVTVSYAQLKRMALG